MDLAHAARVITSEGARSHRAHVLMKPARGDFAYGRKLGLCTAENWGVDGAGATGSHVHGFETPPTQTSHLVRASGGGTQTLLSEGHKARQVCAADGLRYRRCGRGCPGHCGSRTPGSEHQRHCHCRESAKLAHFRYL
jgi:hypothetical protein